jgi:hypothetical protein
VKEINDEGVLNLIERLLVDSFSKRKVEGEPDNSVYKHRLEVIDSKLPNVFLDAKQFNIDPNVLRQACHLKQNGKPYQKTLQRLGINITERFY